MNSVYIHIVKSNGKIYVGQCSGNPKERWGTNGHRYKGQRFYRAIKKYGWNNIIHNVVATNLTQDEADRLEKFYIKRYKTNDEDHGYNKTEGGKEGCGSPGSKNPNAKPVKCIETGEIFECASYAAKSIGVESSTLIEATHTGYKVKGKHYCYIGDPEKINERSKNYGVERIETGEIWKSIKEASDQLGFCTNTIKRYCTGKRIPVDGYHYKYCIV